MITLKFALIIPLSCKAKLYFCSMENGHANINFMLYNEPHLLGKIFGLRGHKRDYQLVLKIVV